MSQNSANNYGKGGEKSSGNDIKLPLHNILRHLALEPLLGQQLFPNTWSSLRVRGPLEAQTQVSQSLNVHYQLQHCAFAVFDRVSKKWRIEGQGDANLVRILGVIVSKKHGARVIQLPNHTHKVVAGIINGEALLNLFAAPVVSNDGKKVSLTSSESSTLPFVAVIPQYKSRSSSSKVEPRSQFKHLEYILHSSAQKKGGKSQLSWTESPHKTLTVVNGSDVQELSQYKSLLQLLRADIDDSHQEASKKENLEKRLFLLEHQIDGLLKRKINFTSKDAEGSRFLDYTTILNQKENQIITLHKKIDNLEGRLNAKKTEESHLKTEIERLNQIIKTLNSPHATKEDIDSLLLDHIETVSLHKQTQKLKSKTTASHHLLRNHLEDLKLKGVKVENEDKLRTLIDENKDVDVSVKQGVVHLIETKDKLIEVPVHDAKTKELLKQMGLQIYRIYSRYPKIKEEANPQFLELLNKEVINVVDADGLSKITQIVRYIPSLVKVENVYNYNNDKQRKLEFHLKVLLKSLLMEFQKIKAKTGVTPQIDEEAIKMIHEEIGDSVSVDDILKVFQVNQKIVEVPKIVEKIVERVIEVPTLVPVEKIVEKIVYETKIEEVEKIIHVPVEVLKYVDRIVEKIVEVEKIREKIVEVPRIIEKIVERRVEVPKIVEVEVIKEKIIEKEVPVIVERVVNHPVPEIKEVEVIRYQTCVVKEVVEKIKQVEKIVEKIVERVVEKPVIIEVEKIVQKLVNTVNYKPAREVVNYVEHVPQIIQRIVQKVIPIIQTVQKIKEVTKIVEKIVEVRVEVPTVKQVKVIEEKIVYQDRVKEVERVVEKIVTLIKEVIKEVEFRVEVPIIQEKIVIVKQTMEKVVPEKYEITKLVEVEKIVEKLVQVNKYIEVQKPVVKYITIEKPVKVIVEKIIEVPKIVEKIKEVRVPVDKIIEKLVEVPKVVEVEKIVQKIVVVPRIVEKIVEVPQIVERIVDRIVEVEKVKEVIREVNVPIIQEKVVEVQVIKYLEVIVYKEVEVIRQKIVPAVSTIEVIKPVDVIHEKVCEARVQVPKEMLKEKIVPHTVEVEKIVQVEKAIVIPFELPVPCDKVVEKLVLVEKEVEKIVQVPVQIEKIVQCIKEVPVVKEVVKVEQQIVVHEKFVQIEKIVPYITEKVVECEVIREKPVLNPSVQERIKEVAAYQDKIVSVVHEVPKIYEIEKVVEKPVEVPRFIEITAKEPVIITNNKIVDRLVDKLVHTTCIEEKIVEVPTVQEKIVTIQKLVQQIKQIHVNKDKIVEKDKLINRTNVQNKIETKYETVDRIQEKLVPVSGSCDRIVEVPHIMEKVVERIVLMPQVHQVTQHVFDIQEEAHPGVAVDVELSEHQANYSKLYKSFKKDSDALVSELKSMKKSHPELSDRLSSIEKYVSELDKLSEFPKIVQVNKEKVVNRNVPVTVLHSTHSTDKIKNEAFYLVLIEKLIKELKNSKAKTSYAIEDEQIKLLFLSAVNKDDDKKLKDKIDQFKHSSEGAKYAKLKPEESLFSEVLYEKFYFASLLEKSKLQTERYRRVSQERLQLLHRFKQTNDVLHQRLLTLEDRLRALLKKSGSQLNKDSLKQLKEIQGQIQQIDDLLYSDIKNAKIAEPIQSVTKGSNYDASHRLQQSKIRELEAQIEILRKEYVEKASSKKNPNESEDKDRVIDSLRKTITNLVDNKGTKTTLGGDDERRDTITSLDRVGDRSARKPIKNETSIIGFLSGASPTKEKNNDWDEYPIIKEEESQIKNENFGYIILPHGKAEKETKSYKVIENRDNDSYIIIPVGQNGKETKRHETENTENYPFGNPWLPYASQEEQNADHPRNIIKNHLIDAIAQPKKNTEGIKASEWTVAKSAQRKPGAGEWVETKSGERKPGAGEWVETKSGERKPGAGEWVETKSGERKPGAGEWVETKSGERKPGAGEWVETKSGERKPGAGEWVETKSGERKPGAGEWVETKSGERKPGAGEWVETKSGERKPGAGEWVETKNVQTFKPTSSGEWVSSKNAQIQPKRSAIGELTIEHADASENIHIGPPINIIASPTKPSIAESHVEQFHGSRPLDQQIQFNYHQPGTIVIPNLIDPNNVLSLPGQTSRVTYVDQNGAVVNSFNQSGQVDGEMGPGGSYSATYLYKSEVKESGEGDHKVEKTITQIRTNQTVNWISRSRVIDTQIKIESPRKDSPQARITLSPKKEDQSPPKK